IPPLSLSDRHGPTNHVHRGIAWLPRTPPPCRVSGYQHLYLSTPALSLSLDLPAAKPKGDLHFPYSLRPRPHMLPMANRQTAGCAHLITPLPLASKGYAFPPSGVCSKLRLPMPH